MLQPPRQLRPTRAGWVFLLINLGVGFAALNTGNNLLYLVLALLLAFLTLSGILSESALRGIEIRRTLPRDLFANADNPVRIEIRNSQRKVPAFAIVVEDRISPSHRLAETVSDDWRLARDRDLSVVGRVFALRVGPGQTESLSYTLRVARRGVLEFHSVRVSTRFPFGLFLKSRMIQAPGSALVYPEIRPLEVREINGGEETSSQAAVRSRGGGTDVIDLREWQVGDSLRRVHWKSSLRRDRLYVRSQQDDHQAEVEVVLRTRGNPAPEEFEERVCWAASEVMCHLESGLRVGLITDHVHIRAEFGAQQRARLLSLLALVETGGSSATQIREERAGVQ
ncbi:MAG: DUF58 domain-containing protein [Deltaproteobacteria bacterium]|nr:DUF58 domain-containing protein [Deltaproteobacteria bacterium]MBW2723576.1 DUF58 domain-containing protein [Deltaproteobacteria bacterium]